MVCYNYLIRPYSAFLVSYSFISPKPCSVREQRHEHQREHPKRPLLVIDLGRNGV